VEVEQSASSIESIQRLPPILISISTCHDQMSKVKLDFYAEIQEIDGVFVILILLSLSGISKGLKGRQRKEK
jgi:hypothetical protein